MTSRRTTIAAILTPATRPQTREARMIAWLARNCTTPKTTDTAEKGAQQATEKRPA